MHTHPNSIYPFLEGLLSVPFYKALSVPFYMALYVPFYRALSEPFYRALSGPFYRALSWGLCSPLYGIALLQCLLSVPFYIVLCSEPFLQGWVAVSFYRSHFVHCRTPFLFAIHHFVCVLSHALHFPTRAYCSCSLRSLVPVRFY